MKMPEHNKLQVKAFKETDIPIEMVYCAGFVLGSFKALTCVHSYTEIVMAIINLKTHI